MQGIFEHDRNYSSTGYKRIAGIDEAGRGPLAGPVVAAAVVLMADADVPRLRDSKKVPESEREELFVKVISNAEDVGIGISGVELIEIHNILGATKLAMAEAVDNLMERPDILLIDAVKLPEVDIKQVSIIKGDSKSAAIAAASIVAKYVRDRIMLHYHNIYPEYGFDRHKGYSTSEHMEKITRLGPCPIHRKGFRRVMSLKLPL